MFKPKMLLKAWQQTSSGMKWKTVAFTAILSILAFAPLRARGQFGLDPCCAIISTGLNSISGLLKNVVAKPLASIQSIQQQAAAFQQQVVYPVAAVNEARGLAGRIRGELQGITQLYRLPTNSASLPTPQQFERSLLSHNPGAGDDISEKYASLYGRVMAPSDAPQPIRDVVDMTDAAAQEAFKKAVELDAIADVELAVADRINQGIENAAPGTVPILDAQASAWLVRANAYTQSAMAELIRVRSIELANAGAQLKLGATDLSSMNNNAVRTMQLGVR